MTGKPSKTAEHKRLEQAREGAKWRRWGNYLSERQWGTVREDYSKGGDAWGYLTHEQAPMRAYRWGEDGLLGLCDNRGLIHFALALWNGKDPILKERLFGLSNPEGNHGEDVKEIYHYLDATPTCSYSRALYKYPHAEFPYEELRRAAREAGRDKPEPELWDTGVFEGDAYFDVVIEYCKANIEDVFIRISITNRGPAAKLHVLPTVWFRNTWSWGVEKEPKPHLRRSHPGESCVLLQEDHLGKRWLYGEAEAELLFTENDTNKSVLFGAHNESPYTKDAFHRYVVRGDRDACNGAHEGTKAAFLQEIEVPHGETRVLRLRLTDTQNERPFDDLEAAFDARVAEADEFYTHVMPTELGTDEKRVYRQAVAGLIWSKQFYHFDVHRWLKGDPGAPPPQERKEGRNAEWTHLYNSEVLSMPDKWEYPWYAAWDLAFHCVPMALVDPEFAKQQLSLLTREWYMHPNGQLPAYEWAFGDVNPPVHAWAALRVYQIERRMTGRADRGFLESIFHKLMLNFTWWVNRKDTSGKNVFQGGFLGLDNIGVFDRSAVLPNGGSLEQADATSWMGMYCLNLLEIALELARENPRYQDVANKFYEHFLLIARAINFGPEGESGGLWDERDGFFYDSLRLPGGVRHPMRVRSMVGLIPLFGVGTLEGDIFLRYPEFAKRVGWFMTNRPELGEGVASIHDKGSGERRLLSLMDRSKLLRVLSRLVDEREFLSPYGVRALSKVHADKPFVLELGGTTHRVDYDPGDSSTGLFGGNSNWRGPVWFPVNYLLIESLQRYHYFYGNSLRIECPRGSGKWMNLWEVASELSRRLCSVFTKDASGMRPAHAGMGDLARNPHFADNVLFYEYFHGENGRGLGASHQTGWTALVAKLLQQSPLWNAKWDDKAARMVIG